MKSLSFVLWVKIQPILDSLHPRYLLALTSTHRRCALSQNISLACKAFWQAHPGKHQSREPGSGRQLGTLKLSNRYGSLPHLLCNEVCLLLLICAAYELQAVGCAFLHDPLPHQHLS